MVSFISYENCFKKYCLVLISESMSTQFLNKVLMFDLEINFDFYFVQADF